MRRLNPPQADDGHREGAADDGLGETLARGYRRLGTTKRLGEERLLLDAQLDRHLANVSAGLSAAQIGSPPGRGPEIPADTNGEAADLANLA